MMTTMTIHADDALTDAIRRGAAEAGQKDFEVIDEEKWK